jgi:hypothetical protein
MELAVSYAKKMLNKFFEVKAKSWRNGAGKRAAQGVMAHYGSNESV